MAKKKVERALERAPGLLKRIDVLRSDYEGKLKKATDEDKIAAAARMEIKAEIKELEALTAVRFFPGGLPPVELDVKDTSDGYQVLIGQGEVRVVVTPLVGLELAKSLVEILG